MEQSVQQPELDFLIIGATKCSTTWLQTSLQQAPDVYMPDAELHFFSKEFARGYEWYAEHFPPKPSGSLVGEKSNSYLSDPAAAERIHAVYPDIRLVALLRNPVARAHSDYCMLLRRGDVGPEIEDYLDPARATFRRFLDKGLYASQLAPFLSLFPRDAIQVLFFEDMRAAPQPQFDRLARHLGRPDGSFLPYEKKVKDSTAAMVPKGLRSILKPLRPILDPVRDTAPIRGLRRLVAREATYPPLNDDLAQRLRAYYANDVRALEDICQRRLDDWLAGSCQKDFG